MKRNGGPREIEGTVTLPGNDFDHIRVGDVFGGAGNAQSGDLDFWLGEGCQQSRKMGWREQRFIALDINVDIGRSPLRNRMETVGAAGESGGGHAPWPAVPVAKRGDLLGIDGNEDLMKKRTGRRRFVDPGKQRPAGDLAQHLAWQTRGSEPGGDHAERTDP